MVPVDVDKRAKKYERKQVDGSGKRRDKKGGDAQINAASMISDMHAKNEGVQLNEQLS